MHLRENHIIRSVIKAVLMRSMFTHSSRWIGAIGLLFALAVALGGQKRPMDTAHSRLTVRVGKSGFLSGLAHDHEISAPIDHGDVVTSIPASVTFTVQANKLSVLDPGESESTRAEVHKTMLGSSVLDAAKFPEIKFVSDNVERLSDSKCKVHGRLPLHGQTHPVSLETILEKGHYRGTASVLQTSFGITPIQLAGGTVKVKNEVRIEYDIVLAGQ